MWKETANGIILSIKVIPKACNTEIVGVENDALKLRLAAVPEKGQANAELIRFLSKTLKISKSNISLHSGETSRYKKVLLKGIDPQTLKSVVLK